MRDDKTWKWTNAASSRLDTGHFSSSGDVFFMKINADDLYDARRTLPPIECKHIK